jgi:hypothetical protein
MAGSAVTANRTIMDIVLFSSTACAPPHLALGAAWGGLARPATTTKGIQGL